MTRDRLICRTDNRSTAPYRSARLTAAADSRNTRLTLHSFGRSPRQAMEPAIASPRKLVPRFRLIPSPFDVA